MKFDRLGSEFLGFQMNTPLTGASGTFGFGSEYEDFLSMEAVGAVISKGITPIPRAGNEGVRIAETPGGMLNCIGLENPGVDVFLRDILPQARRLKTRFIVNMSAGSTEDYGELAARLDVEGIDAVEVNISCPNVKEGGIVFGTDPKAAAAVTESVRKHTKKPVIVKLSPNVTDITVMAKAVEAAGADAVSVLTERDYFKRSIEYLRDIAKSIGLPVLRKDFMVEPYQIYEAKAAGAAAVLLICALLPQEELTELVDLTRSLDMDALVEAHNKEEISQALWAGADIIGVNNRNLKDFTVSLDTSVNLRRAVPKEIIFVAESGICSAEDILLLRKNRVDAVLIGESLMRSDNKKRTLAALKGVGGED